jgi:hypothetical protein
VWARRTFPAWLVGATLVAALLAMPAAATPDPRGSSDNWAGYAAYGTTFRSVGGEWAQPAANCFGRSVASTAASFWVGIGGNGPRSTKIEQIGTESDCDADGQPDYYAWYELWPADGVIIADSKFHVEPGDKISAHVSVEGTVVALRLENFTTGDLYADTLTMRAPDLSSAEWIAEAPAVTVHDHDQILPLTDFGTVRFTGATATSTHGHTGPVSDPAWRQQAIDFKSDRAHGRDPVTSFLDTAAAAHGFPSALLRHGGTFSITWSKGEHLPAKKNLPPGAL